MLEILTQQNALIELQNADWIRLSVYFAQLETAAEKQSLIRTLSAHIGFPILEIEQEIHRVFSILNMNFLPAEQQEIVLENLQNIQQQATLKIMRFQQRDFFKTINMSFLFISRTHWNELIDLFEKHGREHLSIAFFRIHLSAILNINILTLDSILSQPVPHRATKHARQYNERSATTRWRHSYIEDHGVNPLIYDKTGENPELEKELADTGVRIVELFPATPVRGYDVRNTPGGSKVRSVYKSTNEGAHHDTLYKHLTPSRTPTENGRITISEVITQAGLQQKLPRLNTQRAVQVEYTATLAPMLARSGMRRTSTRTQMGASASAVFSAHGIQISPKDKYTQHWSHLIAHFLTTEGGIKSTTPEKELINLVPTTAAANYNTLEAVELFIKNKLMNAEAKVNEIRIQVTPTYAGENLIPQSLIYNLRWSETEDGVIIAHNDSFYINPQSHMRLTKTMHQSIAVIRKKCSSARFFGLSDTETDTDIDMQDDLIHSPQGRKLDFSSFDSCESE